MKKYWKKIIIIAAAVIVAALIGTKIYGSTINGTVNSDLKAIKNENFNVSTLVQTYSLDSSIQGKLGDVIEKVLDFDYDIQSKSVNGDKAKVKVRITTYDFAKAYKSAVVQIAKDKAGGKISSGKVSKTYVSRVMFNKILALDDKTYSKVITITCTKNDDGKWETDAATNKALMNAIFGGLVKALNS